MKYKVTDTTMVALKARPNLANSPVLRRLEVGGESDLEIVRVLNNQHYPQLAELIDLIEAHLPELGDVGRKLLQAQVPEVFSATLGEFFIFLHLRDRLGQNVTAIKEDGIGPTPDLEAVTGDGTALIEVYSPSDFTGNQRFERELGGILKRLDVPFGYRLSVRVQPQENPNQPGGELWYVYDMPHESAVGPWARRFRASAETWIEHATVGDTTTIDGPLGVVSVEVTLDEKRRPKGDTEVEVQLPGRSTDTRLYFECGTPADTARGPWGSKIASKLQKRQAGDGLSGRLRVLVVNFALADAGWPEFIGEPRFSDRLNETLALLYNYDDLPYDVVIPANLRPRSGFGKPIVLDEGLRPEIEKFVRDAGLDVPVEPQASQTPAEFLEELEQEGLS